MADASDFWTGEDKGFGGKSRAQKRPTDVATNDKEAQEHRDTRPSTAAQQAAKDQARLDGMLVKFPRTGRKDNRKLNWSYISADLPTMRTLRDIILMRGDDNRAWINNTKYKELTDEIEGKKS